MLMFQRCPKNTARDAENIGWQEEGLDFGGNPVHMRKISMSDAPFCRPDNQKLPV